MAKKNSIDQIVENLVDEFSKIQNFQLTQEDEVGKKFFSFAISIAIEFNSFQTLFIQYYLPASRRSIIDTKREIKQSNYKHLISIPEDDFMENYYETIRLGYVGAYHKYENFINRMVSQIDDFFKNLDEEEKFKPVKDYLKSEFNIDIKKTVDKFYITQKINWISNCVKHYDSLPEKKPTPESCRRYTLNQKLRIESKEFKQDVEFLITHNKLMLTTFILIGFHQVFNIDIQEMNIDKNNATPKELEILTRLDGVQDNILSIFNNSGT